MKTIIRPETEMKNSGIEWIGNIPQNWDAVQIRRVLLKDKNGIKIGPFGSALTNKTTGNDEYYVYSQANLVSGDFSDTKNKVSQDVFNSLSNYEVVTGDVCLSMMGTIGKCRIIPHNIKKGIMDSHLIKIRLDNYNSRFFEYVYDKDNGGICFVQMQKEKKGSIMDGLNTSIVKGLYVTVPPLSEQQAIADYLDKTCSKINEIIAEAKESIDEYKELKQSVIFEAVTKGLDKNVEMKEIDGWIRWLPKGWNFRKINGLFNVIGSGTTPKSSIEEYYQGTINWLQSGDINGTVVKNTKKHISDEIVENTSALVVYDAPFIAIAMYGASIGNISIVDINACTNQACCVLSQPTKDIDMGYSFWCIMSAKEELLLSSRGGGQPNISQNIIKQLRIPLPPLMEQRKIADYLSDKTKEIDSLITEKESLINDLEAYKKSLIYEVVTGKRRVV